VSRSFRSLAGWLLAVGLLVAVSAPAVLAADADTELDAAQRQVAETIYANQCATCHGASGTGGTIPGTDDPAPALVGNPDVTVGYVDLTIRVGRMPPPEN